MRERRNTSGIYPLVGRGICLWVVSFGWKTQMFMGCILWVENIDVPGIYPLGGLCRLSGGHEICNWDTLNMDYVMYVPNLIPIVWKM